MRRLGALLARQKRNADAESSYRSAVDAGDLEATYELGAFHRDIGDFTKAEHWLRKAADRGHVRAQRAVAELLEGQNRTAEADQFSQVVLDYLAELGRELDASMLAADQAFLDHLVGAGRLHYDYGDNEEAKQSFQDAADAGSVDGVFWLAVLREEQGDKAGAEELYRRVSAEHPAAAGRLGALLEDRDPDTAEQLYERAYASGDAEATYRLGVLRERTGRDIKAEELYRASAEAHHAPACWALVELLQRQGRLPEAQRWTGRAAEAAYLYGSWFEQRNRDTDAAVWYRKAAEAGNLDAAFSLGMLLRQGEQSDHWMERAAEGGHQLALLLRRGSKEPIG
jgi:TPR repeat protein